MKNLLKLSLVLSLFTLTMCGISRKEQPNDTPVGRIVTIESVSTKYGNYEIIQVNGKEYLCNIRGGMIPLSDTNQITLDKKLQ